MKRVLLGVAFFAAFGVFSHTAEAGPGGKRVKPKNCPIAHERVMCWSGGRVIVDQCFKNTEYEDGAIVAFTGSGSDRMMDPHIIMTGTCFLFEGFDG